jgi:transcriptional regulator with XRE-family HTH domain
MDRTPLGLRLHLAQIHGGFEGRKDFTAAYESSPSTLQRTEEGKRKAKRSELREIAAVTGVPFWWLEGGWENYPGAAKGVEDDGPDLDPRDLARRLGDEQDEADSA